MQVAQLYSQYNNRLSLSLLCIWLIKKLGRISPDERKRLKIWNIETRFYDSCNLIYLSYSVVYNIIVFGVIYYILHYINFKDTTNCISSNDRLVDCVLKWKKAERAGDLLGVRRCTGKKAVTAREGDSFSLPSQVLVGQRQWHLVGQCQWM